MVLTASEYGRSSLEDSDREQGLFTYYFLKAFDRSTTGTAAYSSLVDVDQDGILVWDEIFNYVQPQVLARSTNLGYAHEPEYINNLTEQDSVLRPTLIEENSTAFNKDLFSMNFSVYGSNHIESLSYTLQLTDGSTVTDVALGSSNYEFGTYEVKYTPIGSINVTDYVVRSQFSNGMKLYLFNSSIDTDSDNDDIPDEIEDLLGLMSSTSDTDGDGLNDYQEICVYGTNPKDTDTDDDNLIDTNEIREIGTSPFISDCDNDGLTDEQEYNIHNTDPYERDTDLDGFGDLEEIKIGSDPNDQNNTPNDIRTKKIIIAVTISSVAVLLILLIIYVKKRPKPTSLSADEPLEITEDTTPNYMANPYNTGVSFQKTFATPINPNSFAYMRPYPQDHPNATYGFQWYQKAVDAEKNRSKMEATECYYEALRNGVPEPYNSEIRVKYGISPITGNAVYPSNLTTPQGQISRDNSYNQERSTSETTTLTMQFCPHCGSKLVKQSGGIICPECGYKP
ncbi:MAG: hypothetical protein GF364_15630 [Candidatus Lokiarchaeota archaeon]|nr:hypothetical protein [Candidatus Lokiarchaeota archaeon]